MKKVLKVVAIIAGVFVTLAACFAGFCVYLDHTCDVIQISRRTEYVERLVHLHTKLRRCLLIKQMSWRVEQYILCYHYFDNLLHLQVNN